MKTEATTKDPARVAKGQRLAEWRQTHLTTAQRRAQAVAAAKARWSPDYQESQHPNGGEAEMATKKKTGSQRPRKPRNERLTKRQQGVARHGRDVFRHRLRGAIIASGSDVKEASTKLGYGINAVAQWLSDSATQTCPNILDVFVLCDTYGLEPADILPTLAEIRGVNADGSVPQRHAPKVQGVAADTGSTLDGMVDAIAGQMEKVLLEKVTERLMGKL